GLLRRGAKRSARGPRRCPPATGSNPPTLSRTTDSRHRERSGRVAMTAVVLDGNENQAVAAARSLARSGHRVVVGAETAWSKAGWSRACSRRIVYASPQDDAKAFVAAVAAEVARVPRAPVLPMTERPQ